MPELPEVETVRSTLAYQLGHPTFTYVCVTWRNIIAYPDVETFTQILQGKTIEAYERIGKYLIFDLGSHDLICHLRMEGKFYVEDKDAPYDKKHTHVFMGFTDGRELRYHDTRKFGKMYVYEKGDRKNYPCFKAVGYDAFDERLSADYIYAHYHARHITLKQALLDQSVIAGIGNIYANEICFACGLHPETKTHRLRKKDCERILQETRRILNGAVNAGGTTIRSYTSSLGVHGRFQLKLKVHARENEECLVCHTKIQKKQVATRGTYFCPKCQKRR